MSRALYAGSRSRRRSRRRAGKRLKSIHSHPMHGWTQSSPCVKTVDHDRWPLPAPRLHRDWMDAVLGVAEAILCSGSWAPGVTDRLVSAPGDGQTLTCRWKRSMESSIQRLAPPSIPTGRSTGLFRGLRTVRTDIGLPRGQAKTSQAQS